VVPEPVDWRYEARTLHLDIDLPPHAVAAITIEGVLDPRCEG
jgi:hypothetical protein